MALVASKRDLLKAFQKHKACYEALGGGFDRCRRMVLFYAVETGLKYYLLTKIQKNTTEELTQHRDFVDKVKNGHNIRGMLKWANMESQYKLASVRCKNGATAEPSQYHEIWRYGMDINDASDEERIEMVLCSVMEYLEGNILQNRVRRRS